MKSLITTTIAMFMAVNASVGAWAATDVPAPIKMLKEKGFKITGQFEAPGKLIGYGAIYNGRPMTIYLTPDHKRVILGTMIDRQGNNLSAGPLQRLTAKRYQNIWPSLEQSSWVADGSDDADRVVYAFTDANCPFCHKFWMASRPWVKAGKVQIREIMVGVIKSSSRPKAATILAADNSAAALKRNEQTFSDGGITPLNTIPSDLKEKVNANNRLMRSLGFHGTPTIVYREQNGDVRVVTGMPQGHKMLEVMGGPKPE